VAAKTLEQFQAERRGSRDLWRAITMRDIWDAATVAVEEKFSSHNTAMDAIATLRNKFISLGFEDSSFAASALRELEALLQQHP
jgi:hypothetical protein